jgi:CRISPR-associated protein Cas2
MDVLLAYDVDTTTPQGRRRLRRMAQLCEGFGLRVQQSVFEMVCSDADLVLLTHKAADIIDPQYDSVRIYRLPNNTFHQVTTLGIQPDLPHRDGIII